MSLRLILGRAGSGKSSLIYREMNDLVAADPSGPPIWLLVPEQATSQVERHLTASLATPGLMRARVVSFRRLAYQLLHEVAGAALVQLGEIGRQMILRRVIEQQKQSLLTFYRSANQPGFSKRLGQMISELKSCCVTPEQLTALLAEQAGSLTPTLQRKLHDLALLTRELQAIYGQQYLDGDDSLTLLVENLPQSPSVAGHPVWLDGFGGFTAKEYRIIEQLLVVCNEVTISLTLPADALAHRLRDDDVFYSPWSTAKTLLDRAAVLGVPVEQIRLADQGNLRASGNPTLSFLEANYFDRLQPPFAAETQGLTVVAASNRRAEVEAAAGEIIRLCRQAGYRYREIAITVRDFAHYDYLLTTVLGDVGIPHFLDKKRTVDQHPALELVRGALETALDNFPYEAVFRCLKTDLFPLSRDQVDILENYVLATGTRGQRRWLAAEDWPLVPEPHERDQAEVAEVKLLNDARRSVATYLGNLAISLRQAGDVRGYAAAIYQFMNDLGVPETLFAWAEAASARGELEAASLHTQVWSALVELLDEAVAGLDQEQIPLREFARIIASGLETIELGLIPPELDQVVVTSLGRSRHPEVKAMLVLGVTEGVLPARPQSDGILTEQERQLLANCQLELGPSAERRLFDEQYLIYSALTKASDRLWLSYPLADEEGAALLPSTVIKRLRELFPELRIREHQLAPTGLDGESVLRYLPHPTPAVRLLAAELREAMQNRPVAPIWWDVYSYLLFSSKDRPALLRLLAARERQNREGNLSERSVRRLYGRQLRASVSRIERYNACPFAFFSTYGLRLKERNVHRLAAPDLGTFFHSAMDRFVLELKQRQLDWGELPDEQYKALTKQIVEELSPKLQHHILDSSARFRHVARKLERTVERSARILGKHQRQGKFQPVAVELAFGPDGHIPGLAFDLGDGSRLELAGRIDRLDLATTDAGQSYLRVIDYKSGSARLTPLEVYYGLKLQLLTYLHVAKQCAADLLPDDALEAGALYFRIHDPLQTVDAPLGAVQAEAKGLLAYRMQGLLLDDPTAVQLMDETHGSSTLIPVSIKNDGSLRQSESVWSREELAKMREHLEQNLLAAGKEIMQGNIAITPYRLDKETACRFCAYAAICQFDPLLPENDYRWLPKLPREEIMRRLSQQAGGDDLE